MNPLPPSFEALVRESELPVLVDFYADWCGPCKSVAPVVKQIAGEYKGRIITVKVDTDKKQDVARKWEIQSIPTLMLFFKGRVLMRLSGAHPYANLKRELDQALRDV
jgi:thioredoxin